MPFATRVTPQRTLIGEIYRNNTQNVLQKVAVSSMIGLLQQLNSISHHANEIFTDILQDTDKTNERIKTVKTRLANIEKQAPSVEKSFSDNAPSYFYDNPFSGKEYQRRDPLRGLLFRRDRSSLEVNRRRNIAEEAPDKEFSVMDQFSVHGPCIKSYTDPNFFMNEWLEAEKRKMEEERQKRKARKQKKKKHKRQVKGTIQAVQKKKYNALGAEFQDSANDNNRNEVIVKQYTLTGDTGDLNDPQSPETSQPPSSQHSPKQSSQQRQPKQFNGNQNQKQQHQPLASYMPSEQQINQSVQQANSNVNNIPQQKRPPPISGIPGQPPMPPMPPIPANNGPPPAPGHNSEKGPPPMAFGPQNGQPPMPPVPGGPPGQPQMQQQQQRRPLTGAERAALSAKKAAASGAYQPAVIQPMLPEKPKPMLPQRSNNLLDAIKSGQTLRKAKVVKREIPQDARSLLLANLKKGQNLRHVTEEDKQQKKVVEMDRTVHAILTRRAFLEDDSDEESDSSWGSEED